MDRDALPPSASIGIAALNLHACQQSREFRCCIFVDHRPHRGDRNAASDDTAKASDATITRPNNDPIAIEFGIPADLQLREVGGIEAVETEFGGFEDYSAQVLLAGLTIQRLPRTPKSGTRRLLIRCVVRQNRGAA